MKVTPTRMRSLKMIPMRMVRVTPTRWPSRTRWLRLTVTGMPTPTRSQTPIRSRMGSDLHSRMLIHSHRWPKPMGSNLQRVRVMPMGLGWPMRMRMARATPRVTVMLMPTLTDSKMPTATVKLTS